MAAPSAVPLAMADAPSNAGGRCGAQHGKARSSLIKLDFLPGIGGNFASPLGGISGPKAAHRRRLPAISEPPATAAPRSRSTYDHYVSSIWYS